MSTILGGGYPLRFTPSSHDVIGKTVGVKVQFLGVLEETFIASTKVRVDLLVVWSFHSEIGTRCCAPLLFYYHLYYYYI